jgi:hypothetical protein
LFGTMSNMLTLWDETFLMLGVVGI